MSINLPEDLLIFFIFNNSNNISFLTALITSKYLFKMTSVNLHSIMFILNKDIIEIGEIIENLKYYGMIKKYGNEIMITKRGIEFCKNTGITKIKLKESVRKEMNDKQHQKNAKNESKGQNVS